ncbi:MAG TPA: DUF72 domain-containing protein, partial [Opitutaceae bacterium]
MSPLCLIGCPAWAHAPWVGSFFTADARREDFLPQYASVFAATEGNATFYGLPAAETVKRWAGEAPEGFRFCFKFNREISHDLQLVGAEAATARFFERLAPLEGRLGPFFLQLPSGFGANRLSVLAAYLNTLPRNFTYAVEVRHPDFFDQGAKEQALDTLLNERGIDRAIFDTRGLFAAKTKDEAVLDAQRRKPRVPVRFTATGPRPFVRFVGDPVIEANAGAFREWASVAARWISEGRTPHFFVHHPDDTYAPALARLFQSILHEIEPRVPPPPIWPVERVPKVRGPEQMDLFGGSGCRRGLGSIDPIQKSRRGAEPQSFKQDPRF